jgi:hypothetical protein
MYTDIILQQIHVAEIEQKRLQTRLMNEQLRIARLNRPSLITRLTHGVGLMLISAGESLRKEPSTVPGHSQGRATIPRTV